MSNELAIQKSNPINLLEIAVTKGADIGQLKELMDLQERWEKREAKKEFLSAISNFQSIVPVIKKGKTAKINSSKGFFSYKYADLGSISQSIKKALKECGLSYRWEFEESNNKLKCHCYVSHLAGHTEITTMEAGKDSSGSKNDIQQTGSTQTYLQRYTLIGALGLSTAEEDNDAKTSEMSDDDVLDQWKATISQVNTKIELTKLYVQNKKVIDGNQVIQGMMKEKENQLKANPANNNPSTNMP